MNHHSLRRLAVPIVAVGLALLALLPSVAAADVAPDQVPPELKAAIRGKVESEGHVYAGLCKEIAQDGSTTGMYCATVIAMTAADAEVAYGPVASEPVAHITFTVSAGQWVHHGGGPGEGEAPEIPDALHAAIRDFIEAMNVEYGGLCTEVPQDGSAMHQWCSAVEMISDTAARVSYGKVATDEIKSTDFELRAGVWTPVVDTGGAPTPRPPDTGNGAPGNSGPSVDLALVVAGTLVLLSGAALMAARRR